MKQETFLITKATTEDIPAILEMYRRRVLYNNAHGIPQWRLADVTWEAFSQLYTIDDYYVGKCNGEVVCGLFIIDVDKLYWPDVDKGKYLYLHKICVDPAHAKKGYSDAMITYFKDKGRKEGYPEVRLDVREKKVKLREMYERNGFRLVTIGQFVPEFTTALYHYVYAWEQEKQLSNYDIEE